MRPTDKTRAFKQLDLPAPGMALLDQVTQMTPEVREHLSRQYLCPHVNWIPLYTVTYRLTLYGRKSSSFLYHQPKCKV